jgi:hypothetical protein
VKAKAFGYTIPTQAAATFCADTSAVDACKLESRTAAGMASDSCFRVAGVSIHNREQNAYELIEPLLEYADKPKDRCLRSLACVHKHTVTRSCECIAASSSVYVRLPGGFTLPLSLPPSILSCLLSTSRFSTVLPRYLCLRAYGMQCSKGQG